VAGAGRNHGIAGRLGAFPGSGRRDADLAVDPLPGVSSTVLRAADGRRDRQHFNEVQEACPTASHYDTSDTTDYWSLGVGYDDWPGGDCNNIAGHANALYQVAVPHAIWART